MAVKKVIWFLCEKLENSLEAKLMRFHLYIWNQGASLDIKDDYALVMFGQVPTLISGLRVDQLEPFK